MKRFWSKVDKMGARSEHRPRLGRCWLWTACVTAKGYGRFMGPKNRVFYAHRFSYELVVDTVPAGMELDHVCRVKNCVRPTHLSVVTHLENMTAPGCRVGIPSGLKKLAKTHCPHGHPYVGDNLAWNKQYGKQYRACRTCIRQRNRLNGRKYRAKSQGGSISLTSQS